MGTNECSQPTSKSSWDSQDFGDIASPPGHDELKEWHVTFFTMSLPELITDYSYSDNWKK